MRVVAIGLGAEGIGEIFAVFGFALPDFKHDLIGEVDMAFEGDFERLGDLGPGRRG